MINFNTFRAALPALMQVAKGFIPGVAQVESLVKGGEAVAALIPDIVATFQPHEQEALKADIARLADENDAGHQALQDKLAAAAKR
jgi:hypothetical protein